MLWARGWSFDCISTVLVVACPWASAKIEGKLFITKCIEHLASAGNEDGMRWRKWKAGSCQELNSGLLPGLSGQCSTTKGTSTRQPPALTIFYMLLVQYILALSIAFLSKYKCSYIGKLLIVETLTFLTQNCLLSWKWPPFQLVKWVEFEPVSTAYCILERPKS